MTRNAPCPNRTQLTAGRWLCAPVPGKRRHAASMPMDAGVVSSGLPMQVVGNAFETTLMTNPDPGGGGV